MLKDILSRYDGFIVDLWGVVHDGSALYPNALATLQHMHALGKKVVFLSNAPRKAVVAEATLTRLGVDRSLYARVITSGQVAYDMLHTSMPYGPQYYYLGPGKDENIIGDLCEYHRVDSPFDADFVLNTGYEEDFQPHEDVLPTLQRLHEAGLPLLCINPDREVVKQDGTVMLCAGALAKAYEEMEGVVRYIGKPYPEVYDVAKGEFAADARLLCIGDNPLTDIRGAFAAGIDSVLITGGVLQVIHGALDAASVRNVCLDAKAMPTYVLPSFSLT
jgi:HAD superfamily hydrolase (TIGR01459 family)